MFQHQDFAGLSAARTGHVRILLAGLVVVLLQTGCYARLAEDYYLKAHDPRVDVTNYFKITLSGQIWFSKAKYSVGFYDREAVDKLFGESAFEQEFLVTRLRLFALDSDEKLKELSSTLSKLESVITTLQKEQLLIANATAAGLVEHYRTRLEADPDIKAQFSKALRRAIVARKQAEKKIAENHFDEARAKIREVQLILEVIRIALDSTVLVRFFDGAGNEIDVTNRTLVIFVATDIARFAEALRQLAESKEATDDLLLTVLGRRIQEAEVVATRLQLSNGMEKALSTRLNTLMGEIAEIPKPSEPDQEAVRRKEIETIRQSILKAATALAGRGRQFENSSEIRAFAQGMSETK